MTQQRKKHYSNPRSPVSERMAKGAGCIDGGRRDSFF